MSSDQIGFQGRRFRVIERHVRTPGGKSLRHELVDHAGAAVIVPLVDNEHVCMIRNFRPAIGKTLLELPAGTIEAGEDPATTAVRELAEEAGYRPSDVKLLHDFWMSPGILNERMWLFAATGLKPVPQQLDASEEIEPEVVTWAEALNLVDRGEVQDAKTLVALLFYDRIRRRDRR